MDIKKLNKILESYLNEKGKNEHTFKGKGEQQEKSFSLKDYATVFDEYIPEVMNKGEYYFDIKAKEYGFSRVDRYDYALPMDTNPIYSIDSKDLII